MESKFTLARLILYITMTGQLLHLWSYYFTLLYSCSRIHKSLIGDKLRHRAVVPARQPCSLTCRYDNPMPKLTLSPSQGSMNSATGFSSGLAYIQDMA
jgi:hypothetical protein